MPMVEPTQILSTIRKIVPNSRHSDKDYNMIDITKKEFSNYVMARFKGLNFAKKIVQLFYPSGGDSKKLRYIDYYRLCNQMIEWNRID